MVGVRTPTVAGSVNVAGPGIGGIARQTLPPHRAHDAVHVRRRKPAPYRNPSAVLQLHDATANAHFVQKRKNRFADFLEVRFSWRREVVAIDIEAGGKSRFRQQFPRPLRIVGIGGQRLVMAKRAGRELHRADALPVQHVANDVINVDGVRHRLANFRKP